MDNLFSSATIRALLLRYEIKPNKSLGQHFLISEPVIKQLLAAAHLHRTAIVVEVGPGLGTITRALVTRVRRVIAIEFDQAMCTVLAETLAGYASVEVVEQNILTVDLAPYVGREPYQVVAALPYNIATAVIRRFLDAAHPPIQLTVLVQREVAERLVAQPGSKERAALSVLIERVAAVNYIATVPAHAFYPPPRVESAIITITPYQPVPADQRRFRQVVLAGFSSRRKQLINSLSAGLALDRSVVAKALAQSGIDLTRRAETLQLGEWEALNDKLDRDEE